jgi:hypothetical protein
MNFHFHSSLSTVHSCLISACFKSVCKTVWFGDWSLENSNGKLLIYTSNLGSNKEQLEPVSVAAQKMADLLKLNLEVVVFGEKRAPIYVYYKDGEEEPIPVYCNREEKVDVNKICAALRNMLFVLSFHPRHASLRRVRKEIMQSLS